MRCMWPVGADVGLCVTWESNCLSRKLHCPRNTVHVNLFFSFILRCLMALIRDVLMADSAGLRDDTVRYSTSVTDALPSYSPSLSSSSSPLVVSAIAAVQWHDMTHIHDTGHDTSHVKFITHVAQCTSVCHDLYVTFSTATTTWTLTQTEDTAQHSTRSCC